MSDSRSHRWQQVLCDDRFVLGALVLCLVWLVGVTFDTKPVCFLWFGLAVLGAVAARLRRRRADAGSDFRAAKIVRSKWWDIIAGALLAGLMVASVVAVFSWRFASQVNQTSSLLVLSVDTLAHCCIVLACILWSVASARGHAMLLVLGLVAVLMAVAGGGVSSTLTAQTAVGLATSIGFMIAAQIIVSRSTDPSSARRIPRRHGDATVEVVHKYSREVPSNATSPSRPEERFSFTPASWPYLLLTISLILITASAIARVGETVLPGVQAGVFAQLKDRFEDTAAVGFLAGGRYVSGNRIGDIQSSLLNDPAGLALRGYCSTSPGYLRGNVFDDYSDGRWNTQRRWIVRDGRNGENVFRSRMIQSISKAKVPLNRNANPLRSRFPLVVENAELSDLLPISSQPIIGTIEIYGQPERGPQTFFPANTTWIEAKARQIGVTPHGLIDRGVDSDQPWVVGVVAKPITENLNAVDRGLMLWVEPRIRPTIQRVARNVARNARTPAAKASQIASYFQRQYTYTLRTEQAPSNIDPLVHFLNTEHPAHCEYFASAAALMLRTLDVPTRYVTGYVMDELSDSSDYYLARNRDAHAWIEYYDESARSWRSLETTPGRTYQTIEPLQQGSNFNSQGVVTQESDSVSESWLRGFTGYLMSLRLTDTLSVVFQVLQIPVLILLVGWLWWRAQDRNADTESQRVAIERRKMDRRLKRWGWVRHASETLHQFAARLEAAPLDDPRYSDLQSASAWYRDHAVILYRRGPSAGS